MQQMLGSMTRVSLDRSIILDLGFVREDGAEADVVVSGIKELNLMRLRA